MLFPYLPAIKAQQHRYVNRERKKHSKKLDTDCTVNDNSCNPLQEQIP